ncbi:MAG: AraC family transcriptional regulator [Lentisphaeria bacterium]|nr:AraC family transcriptional regulator [Lentisphaeria bacterium]
MKKFADFALRLGREIECTHVNCFQAAPEMNTAQHVHWDQLHINCIESGTGICIVNGHAWRLRQGNVHIVLPGETHEYKVSKNKPYRSCFLHFRWTGPVPPELVRQLTIPARERRDFFRILHALSDLNGELSSGKELIRNGLLMQFLGMLIGYAENSGSAPFGKEIPCGELYPVIRQLTGPPFEYPGLDALAESVGMSRRKLTSLFRKVTGKSVKQYYLQNVMRHAESIIHSGEFRIADIARQCGYSNCQNFLAGYRKFQEEKMSDK